MQKKDFDHIACHVAACLSLHFGSDLGCSS
jgi:hypothetical protein